MLHYTEAESYKKLLESQKDIFPGGVLYILTKGNEIIWRCAATSFDLEILQVGERMPMESVSMRALRENREIEDITPRSLYGIRLKTYAVPIYDENDKSVGVFSTIMPRLHPLAKAFPDYAPLLSNMFPEGSILFMTDKEKVGYKQSSDKFNLPMEVGYVLSPDELPSQVLKEKKAMSIEHPKEKFGVPTLWTCYPVYDDENSSEVIATFGIVTPKVLAHSLREMAESMEGGVVGIASAIEELAASATAIHESEQQLFEEVQGITELTKEINDIGAFIQSIAGETNMLGLNAAIEAARAGETGKGFQVVATEIRRLSDKSKSAVPRINSLTQRIIEKVHTTARKSQTSLDHCQEQAAASQEISASIEQLSILSEELHKVSKEL